MRESLERTAALIDDYLAVWILLAVAVGLAVPAVGRITDWSTPILAVMVGSVALTLSPERFRAVSRRGLLVTLVGHVTMPLLAATLAWLLALEPAMAAGFLLLSAVTPELVTPTMTERAGGDTALASTVLVVTGLGSLAFVPLVAASPLGPPVAVDVAAIAAGLLLAVVAPMSLAVVLRARFETAVGRYDDLYPSVSALMVILIIGGVAAENAGLLRARASVLVAVGVAVLSLNLGGYALGWLLTTGTDRPTRIAGTLSVGMRDFAIAAALVVSAGYPAAAALPALCFGILELLSSALLGRRFRATSGSSSLRSAGW